MFLEITLRLTSSQPARNPSHHWYESRATLLYLQVPHVLAQLITEAYFHSWLQLELVIEEFSWVRQGKDTHTGFKIFFPISFLETWYLVQFQHIFFSLSLQKQTKHYTPSDSLMKMYFTVNTMYTSRKWGITMITMVLWGTTDCKKTDI